MAGKSTYKEEYDQQAYKLCKNQGVDDKALAEFFGCSVATLNNWKNAYPTFLESLKKGKDDYDSKSVEKSLRMRAKGYEYTEEELRADKDGELKIHKRLKKQMAPDVTAQIFWLKNRQPERWRDKIDHAHTGNITIESSIPEPEPPPKI